MQQSFKLGFAPYTNIKGRQTKFAPTVGRINLCEDFMPPSAARCVESPHPTRCGSMNFVRISRLTPQSWLRQSSSPAGEPMAVLILCVLRRRRKFFQVYNSTFIFLVYSLGMNRSFSGTNAFIFSFIACKKQAAPAFKSRRGLSMEANL